MLIEWWTRHSGMIAYCIIITRNWPYSRWMPPAPIGSTWNLRQTVYFCIKRAFSPRTHVEARAYRQADDHWPCTTALHSCKWVGGTIYAWATHIPLELQTEAEKPEEDHNRHAARELRDARLPVISSHSAVQKWLWYARTSHAQMERMKLQWLVETDITRKAGSGERLLLDVASLHTSPAYLSRCSIRLIAP